MEKVFGTFEKGERGLICRAPSDRGPWIVPDRTAKAVQGVEYLLEITRIAPSGRLRFARIVSVVETECQRLFDEAVAKVSSITDTDWEKIPEIINSLTKKMTDILMEANAQWEAARKETASTELFEVPGEDGDYEAHPVKGWNTKLEDFVAEEKKRIIQETDGLRSRLWTAQGSRLIPGKINLKKYTDGAREVLDINGKRLGITISQESSILEELKNWLDRKVKNCLEVPKAIKEAEELLA